MSQNKKQTTLFDAWKKKKSAVSVSKKTNVINQEMKQRNICDEDPVVIDDDSDIESFQNMSFDDEIGLALELSLREHNAMNNNCPANNYEEHASNHVTDLNCPSTSKANRHMVESTENLAKKCQVPLEKLEGFDVNSGKTWIYPTNYPFREYQFNIVQACLFKNSMVVLPTGLGKTFIAAVIMYNFYRWYPRGKVVFMAPTRPLVNQQIESCFKVMGIPQEDTEVMLGIDAPEKRKSKWLSKRVFFLTPQVINNDISKGVCPVNLLKCLVIDEAHKAQGNHSYCEVIKSLIHSSESQFRVIGLSATPGGDMEAVKSVLKNLLISHIELRSEDSPDIVPYTHVRTIQKVVVKMDEELLSIREKYLKILKNIIVQLQNKRAINGNTNPESLSKFVILKLKEAFGQNPPGNLSKGSYNMIQMEFLVAISLYHAYELLCIHGTRTFYKYMKGNISGQNALVTKFLENNADFQEIFQELRVKHEGNEKPEKGFFPYGHPKLKKLEEIVCNHFKKAESDGDSESTRVMIFSNYRESVEEIVQMLELHEPLVRAMAFVGQNSKNSKGISQKMQLQVIESFRRGGYNTLVSTCVGEEGLDIGEIDLIVCYDAHKSPIRLVQRIGRTGRKRDGTVVSLITEGKEEQRYNGGQTKKKFIDRTLTSESVQQYLYQNSPRMVPRGINPECHEMFMTIKTFELNSSKKLASKKISGVDRKKLRSNNISNMFAQISVAKRQKLEHAYLNHEEVAEWREKYKHPDEDIPTLPKSIFLSISPNSALDQDDAKSSKPIYDLSKWISWQITKQVSYETGHSGRTEVLIHMLTYIENLTIYPEKDPYENDYCNYLNMKDVYHSEKDFSKTTDEEKPVKKSNVINIENDMSTKNVGKRKRPLLLSDDSSSEDITLDPPIIENDAPFTDPHGCVEERTNIITDIENIPNDTLSRDGNLLTKSLFKPVPMLDFDFDKPLSTIGEEEFTSIFGEKVTKDKDDAVSDDGYNSNDDRFGFLTGKDINKLECSKLLSHLSLNKEMVSPMEYCKKTIIFNEDIQKSLVLTKTLDENFKKKDLEDFSFFNDSSYILNKNSISRDKSTPVKNEISGDLEEISPVEEHIDIDTIISPVHSKVKPMFDLESSSDEFIYDPDNSPPKEPVAKEPMKYLDSPGPKICSVEQQLNMDSNISPVRTKVKPLFDLGVSPVKEPLANELSKSPITNFECGFDDENIFLQSDDSCELLDFSLEQNKNKSTCVAKAIVDQPKTNYIIETDKSEETKTERNYSEDLFPDDIFLVSDSEKYDGGSTSTPKAPKILDRSRNILQETKPSNNLDVSSNIFDSSKDESLPEKKAQSNTTELRNDALTQNSISNVAGCDDQRPRPNFDLDFDDVFSLTPEEYDIMEKECPKSTEKDAIMTGVKSFSSSDEKESPIKFNKKNKALVFKDDDDGHVISDSLQRKFLESVASQEKSISTKKLKRKRNSDAARCFINEEAEVSDQQSDDEIEEIGNASYDKSFVNDSEESTGDKSPASMRNVYLQSVKSPVQDNKFKLQFQPKNSNSMIFSQAVETDVSDYEEDSFCVRNDGVLEATPVKIRTKKGPRRIVALPSSSDEEKSFSEPSNNSHVFTRPMNLPVPSKMTISSNKQNESGSWLSKVKSSMDSSRSSPHSNIVPENGSNIRKHSGFSADSSAVKELKVQAHPNEKQVIFVDNKELSKSRHIISSLRNVKGFHVNVTQLKFANYVVSSRVGIYRTTADDIYNGANKTTVEKALRMMLDYFEKPFLILESTKNSSTASVRTMYADNLLHNIFGTDINVLFSESQDETVLLITDLAKQEEKRNFHVGSRMVGDTYEELEETLQFLTNLPHVNCITALHLLESFKSLSNFLNCSSAKELEEKGKIPFSVAKKILQFIEADISIV